MHGEQGATQIRAAYRNGTMMGHDDLFDNGQPQPGSIDPSGKKRLKDLLPVLFFNACAVITDTQDDFSLVLGDIQLFRFNSEMLRTLGTEGQGVVDQLTEKCENLVLVC